MKLIDHFKHFCRDLYILIATQKCLGKHFSAEVDELLEASLLKICHL